MGERASNGRWITDIHTHILPPRLAQKIRAVFESAEGLQSGEPNAVGGCCTPAYTHANGAPSFRDHAPFKLTYPSHDTGDMAALLSAHGLQSVWVLPYAHKGDSMARQLNADVTQLCRGESLARVHPMAAMTVHPDDGPDEVRRTTIDALTRLGCRAAKLHCSVGRYGILHPSLAPFWHLADRVRLPVIVHFGTHVSGHTATTELDDVPTLVRQYPNVCLIVAHCAAPSTQRAIQLAVEHSNVYLDTTPVVTHCVDFPPRDHPLHATVLDLAQRGKILFGSDFPNVAVGLDDQVKHVFSVFSDTTEHQQQRPTSTAAWWRDRRTAESAGNGVTEVLGDAAQRLLQQIDEQQVAELPALQQRL